MTNFVDRLGGVHSELAMKAPCRVVSTTNLTLSGFQTIGTETLTADDDNLRVAVVAQTDASENGIYDAQSGLWTRARDADSNGKLVKGTRIPIGITDMYIVSSDDPIVVGTSDITIEQDSAFSVDLTSGSNPGIELGSLTHVNTPYIDFHSSGNDIDYDTRLVASGGTSTIGHGLLTLNGTFKVTPVATGVQALSVSQSLSGTITGVSNYASAGQYHDINPFYVTSDNSDTGWLTAASVTYDIAARHAFGGSSCKGGREAVLGWVTQNTATSSSNLNRNYVGGHFRCDTWSGDGGGVGTEKGAYFGANIEANAGAGTSLLNLTAVEFNLSAMAGTSVKYKTMLQLASYNVDAVQGTDTDAMIVLTTNGSGSVGWQDGLLIGGWGQFPITTTGTMIRSNNSGTCLNGIDFSNTTMSGFAFKSPGVQIKGNGGYISLFGATDCGIELGRVDGTSSTPFFDFHCGATVVDYDVRLLAATGTGVSGGGSLTLFATGGFVLGATVLSLTAAAVPSSPSSGTVKFAARTKDSVNTLYSYDSTGRQARLDMWGWIDKTTSGGPDVIQPVQRETLFAATTPQTLSLNNAWGVFGGFPSFAADNQRGFQAFIGYSATTDLLAGTVTGSMSTAGGYFIGEGDYAGAESLSGTAAYGAYIEGRATAHATIALEVDAQNTSGADCAIANPNLIFGTGGVWCPGLWLATGGTKAPEGAHDVTFAIGIQNSTTTAKWKKGIVFNATAIASVGGHTEAIDLGASHEICWYSGGGTVGRLTSSDGLELKWTASGGSLTPGANDGASLGKSGTAWSDAYFASGAVLDFNASNVTLTHSSGALASTGVLTSASGTAPPASGATTCGVKVSSTANLGWYVGTGAPTFSAAKGSLYSNTTASTTTTRLYVNTDGGTTWATFTASA